MAPPNKGAKAVGVAERPGRIIAVVLCAAYCLVQPLGVMCVSLAAFTPSLPFGAVCSTKPASLRPLLATSLLLLHAASASAVCHTVTTPPNAQVVSLCAPPWVATPPTATPTADDSVTLTIVVASGATGLTAPSATVNTVDVSASFLDAGDGSYTLQFAGPAGDTLWPWGGLHAQVLLSNGAVFADVDATLVPGAGWSEEASSRGLSGFGAATGFGMCVADVDNDGDVDFFVATDGGDQNQLWMNDGGGGFSNQATAWGVAGESGTVSFGCGFADVNSDGLLDLVVTVWDGNDVLFVNGGGTFLPHDPAIGVGVDGDFSLGLSWGDVDSDGDVDLFMCKWEAANQLYVNSAGVFVDAANSRGVEGDTSAQTRQSLLVDVDGDGDLDLAVVQQAAGSSNELLLNNGAGEFSGSPHGGFLAEVAARGVATGDWNADGAPDLHVAVQGSRDLLYLNDGSGVFSEFGLTAGMGESTGHSFGVAVFDFELDGDVDIRVAVSNGADYAWVNRGGGFTEAASALSFGTSGTCRGATRGDIDSDGDDDVLVGDCGKAYINHNARSELGRSVVVRPLTQAAAQSVFGATVTLECVAGCGASWVGLRVLDGGSGYYSQNAYDAVFGVPIPSAAYNASVRWPADFHPASTWGTHPRLGGIVPSGLAGPGGRLFVVRPAPVGVLVEVVPPWDFVGRGTPAAGDEHTITITLTPWAAWMPDLSVAVAINAQDVSPSWAHVGNESFSVTYVTALGQEAWPWGGLTIDVVVEDAGGLVTTLSVASVPGSTWSEEAGTRGFGAAVNGDARGVCMADVDADGDVDMFVAMTSGADNQLWMNDGSGGFQDDAAAWGLTGNPSLTAAGCGFGDADSDGLLDLMVANYAADVNSLHMNLGGVFADQSAARGVAAGENTLALTWGDVDGDGDIDVVLANGDFLPNHLLINNGTGGFANQAATRGVSGSTPSENTQQALLFDIDGDADLDILMCNHAAANEVFVNDGGGAFVEDGGNRGFSDAGGCSALALADFNGDATIDVYVSAYSGRDRLLVGDGVHGFEDVTSSFPALGPSETAAVFDVENDGDGDVLAGGSVWLRGTADAFVESSASTLLQVDAAIRSVAFLDADGDGDIDVAAGEGGLFINHNAQSGVSRAVVVRPLAASGAPSAFGTSVLLTCVGCGTPWAAIRVVGTTQWWSQNGYDAVFGVPVPSAAYNGSVRWAGDFHPPSNWTTHPRLGGIVPAVLPVVVRPVFEVSLGFVDPWDYSGAGGAPPSPGDPAVVPVTVRSGQGQADVVVVSAEVNGVDVSTTWSWTGGDMYKVVYATAGEDTAWPWAGLAVSIAVGDGGGLVSVASTRRVPGSTMKEVASERGWVGTANSAACVADVDSDGDVDVFVVSGGASNQLWLNVGGGAFTNVAVGWGVVGPGGLGLRGCAFGDADGDGLVDLFVAGYTSSLNFLYMHSGSGFVEDGVARGIAGGLQTQGIAWGDVDGDGDLDILVCSASTSSTSSLFINDGGGVFSDRAGERGLSVLETENACVLADVDGDGDLDGVVVGRARYLYDNDGTGSFSDVSALRGFVSAADSPSYAVVVGDVTGDGHLDLVVSAYYDQVQLFVNGGGGAFEEAGAASGFTLTAGNDVALALTDIEHDGDLDVFMSPEGGGGVVWVNEGRATFVNRAAELGVDDPGTAWSVCVFDSDGDGDEDVLVSQSGFLFESFVAQGGVPNWVTVRPLTAAGALSAFGSVVRVEGLGWVGVRVIDGGSGHYSQKGYDAVVGVPDPDAAYNVSVRWAGDVHPSANWSTHRKLGGVVPALLPAASDRLFIVRPVLGLSVGAVDVWDFLAVVTRVGEEAPPAPGDKVTIPVIVSRATADLTALRATVNGQDVRSSFRLESFGAYTLEYTTVAGQEAWPWAGLRVELAVEDSSGLVSEVMETVVPGTTFAPALASSGLATVPSTSLGVCAADVDGDGDTDMVVVLANDVNQLYLNVGEGVLVEEVGAFPGSDAGNSVGCAVADADGDGDLDVFVAFADAADQLFVQTTAVVFGDEGGARGVDGGGASRGGVWGDVEGDGDVDLFVCVHGGVHVLAVNDGSGGFVNGASAAGVATSKLCEQAIMVDVDGDSDLDIVVANNVNDDELFMNSGGGQFDERASVRGFRHAIDSRGLAAGDVDGDGAFDIVVAQAATPALLFMNDGSGFFSEEGAARGVNGTAGMLSVAFVDLEHDGDLDLVMSGAFGGPSVVWVNHNGFADRSADLGVVTTSNRIIVMDFDGDGDMDLVFSNFIDVFESFAADGGVVNWLKVRPLTRDLARSAFGAVVRVVCVEGCEGEWAAVRSIDGGSGLYGQQAYDAHFGLPVGGTAFDVEVVFVGGARHGKATDAGLGGVAPGSLVAVVDRPYLVDVVGVFGGDGVLGVNDSVVVVVTAGQRRPDLEPGDGCCLVNGVNVRESFVGDGEGRYNLTYVLGEGDAEWGAGELVVVPTLQSVGRNLSMVGVEYVFGDSPAGDPVSPVIEFGCRPGVASANVFEPICVSCPGELLSCNFSYVVESASLGWEEALVVEANYTSSTSASFFVGPFNDSDIATLTVFAVDGGGNANATGELSWRVDTSSPVTTLVTKPDPVTSRDDANFALQCSELVCSFEYRFNGGPLTLLGGNGTVGEVAVVDTVMIGGPERVSSVTASNVSFSMNVSDASMWVNASVGVEVAGLSWELHVVDNVTEVLQLPGLGDGEYVLVAAGRGGDGTSDVTPIKYVFTVDSTPPSVSILLAPVDGERGNPTVVVDADEDDCVFQWRAGPSPLNSSWAVTPSAVIVPEVASSVPHALEVRAVDFAGNVGNTESTSWTPAACPDTIPDVAVTSDVGVSVGQRYVTFEVVGGAEWSNFEHALDGGDWVPSSAQDIILDVGLGGDHELHVRAAAPAVCNSVLAGSRPPPQTVEWTEPAPLPLQVTVLTKPDPSTPDVFAEFELLGSRRLAWFEYSLDGEQWTPTEALLRVGPLQAGSHTMRVRAVDSDGVSRGDVQSHSWAITAASDSSIVLTNLPDGEHSLLVIATDEAGSVEVAPNTYFWRVDTIPPTTTANRTSPRFSSSPAAVIDVSCEGEIDDCKFCWTSDTVAGNCSSTSPLFVMPPDDGYHVVDVRAVDSAGLESTEGVHVEWTVDSTPPVVTLVDVDGVLVPPRYDTGNVDAVLGNTSLRLNLTANEDVVGFDVVLNGGVVGGGRMVDPLLELGDLLAIINDLRVRATDLAGNVGEDVTLRVLVDVTLPETLFTIPPPSLTNAFSVSVGVAGEDDATGSGVDGVEVSLLGEGGAIVDVVVVDDTSGAVMFGNLTTGVYNVTAVSMDVAGNVDECAVVAMMVVDHVVPVSEFSEAVPPLVASSSLAVWAACSEEGDVFARVVGVTGWQVANGTGAVVFVGLPDGSHVVELRSVDVVGNAEVEPYVSAGVAVDTTPPITSTVFGEGLVGDVGLPGVDAATPETTVSVNVSANEAVAGYWVAVDGVRRSELAKGPAVELLGLAEGLRNVSTAAVDLAGNVDPSPSWHTFLVDLTPPDSSRIVSLPPSPTLVSNMSVEVAAEDVAGGVGVSHLVVSVVRVGDDVAWPDMVAGGVGGSVLVSDLTTGVYNVSVVGVDGVGNVDGSAGWELVVVDQVPPVSEFVVAPPSITAWPDVVVLVGANETATTSGRVVGVTGWQVANGTGAVVFVGLPDGSHVVELRSVDVVGNAEVEPYVSAGVAVDTAPPVLFWAADVASFTSSAMVLGCFTANDSTAVSFSASPAAVVVRNDACFEVVVGGDGGFEVNITGMDVAGNVGEVLTTSWVLDRVPPSSVITSSIQDSSPACVHGDVTVCDAPTSATLAVACDDGSRGVEVSPCRPQYAITLVEATVAAGCAVAASTRRRLSTDAFVDAPTTSFSLDAADGDGLYAVAVRSVDAAGNAEVGNTTLTWFVDTEAPATAPTLVQTPERAVSSTTALFVIQLPDDNSPGQTAFLFKLDDGQEMPVSNLPSPNVASVQLVLPGLAEGDHKVEVWARDQAGHDSPFVLYDWAIATEAPGVDILSTPAAISADVTPSFVFQAVWSNGTASGSGVEPLAGIEVSLGEGFAVVCEDTVSSGGVCVWNASLADRGEATYTVNVRALLGGNTGDPTAHTWSYTLCDDDEYAVIGGDGGIECFACPPGGDCSGRRTTQADIAAVQGFWAPEGSTGERFYECPVEEACLPGGTAVFGNATLHVVSQCSEGYKGTLCAVCEDGFFEQFGLCVSCGTQSGVAWVIMFAVLVAVIGVGVLFFKFRDLMPIDQLKVTLSMVQIIASANTAYAIPWPPLFADFLNTMRVFLIEAVSLTRANCAQPMTFYGSLTVTLVAFKVVLLVVVFGPVLLHKWKQRGRQHTLPPARPAAHQEAPLQRTRRRSSLIRSMVTAVHAAQRVDWAKIFKITFLFLFVAYPGVSLKIMKTFKCVEVEGEFWLVADMRLRCYEGDWFGYALYALVMACLYTAGLPLAITVILWRSRGRLQDAGVVAKWGFLFETYGVEAYLWEVVELLRKLWLSALVVLMEEGSPLQVTVAVLICGWAHVLHAVYKPWRGIGDGGTSVYTLQHGSLFVTCFVFLMGLLFKVEGVSQDGETYNFLAWAMLLACVGFLLAAAFVLVTAVATQLRKSQAKASLTGSRSSDRRTTRDAVRGWSGGALPSSTGDAALGSRPGAEPRAVRASRMGGARAGQMAWVGNPLKALSGDAGEKGTPVEQ